MGQHRWLPHRGRKSAHARKRPPFGQHRFAIQIKLRAAARLMWREAARDHANGHGSNARETTEKRDGELFLKELQLTNEKQTGGLQPRARAKGGASSVVRSRTRKPVRSCQEVCQQSIGHRPLPAPTHLHRRMHIRERSSLERHRKEPTRELAHK